VTDNRRVAGVVEIRTYKLLPGTGGEFHRTVVDEVMPLLERWGTKVVAFGPSLDGADLYFLLRGYESVEDLQASQDEFYGSDEWRSGPREAIVSRIESSISVVIPAGELEPARWR
jgi:NIPSNAP